MARPNGRHSRSVFVWTLGLLAFAFGIGEWGLPALVEPIRDPAYHARRELLLQNRITAAGQHTGKSSPPLLVMLGTSRTQCGFDGRTAQTTASRVLGGKRAEILNFGTPGGNILYQLLVLERLLRDGIEPDIVFVEVLPKQLHAESADDLFQTRAHAVLESDRRILDRHESTRSLAARGQLGWPAVWSYRRELIQAFLPPWFGQDVAGKIVKHDRWGGYHPREQPNDATARAARMRLARSTYERRLGEFRLGDVALRGLREMIALCQERNIRTALVLMPEGPEFRSWYRPGARREILDALGELAAELDSQLIDGCEWFDDESLFRDSHHLTRDGASRFTERLIDTALPGLARSTAIMATRPASGRPLK